MTAYIGILEKEPGTLWGIWFPDLPGCIAAAGTADETISQAGEALAQWFSLMREDGETPPPPRTIEQLRGDADFAEALAAGHMAIVIRPPVDELDLDDGQLRAVDEAAERRGLSRRGVVRAFVLSQISG
ncbi:MAG: type II toxin-antitoxin system HicB family antitoxin [Methylobacterium sp.]|jgi:predicted RNase H-like HicB family nuclease|uniref:type II toxin-antitoxin system HicB family antitoxin n=1 Tax=unclassified Methylobacterium TaxID=2615210 RepID=UPI0006F6C3F9|nr:MULTISPECIES: type II toxin-antitoxin system HicB family antitoxin [unclassified Methylobacterium]KQP05967.1 hypothetical protein ASF28_17155 [Methylobacterium sp. Leaf99]MDO9427936.1 type II toxin-antitoxin system HicB family antitoxin [Methylobacterium sp.]TXM78184.1 HicB family protein [Methylobacterium sp. WL69]